jgi:hypothetical protein
MREIKMRNLKKKRKLMVPPSIKLLFDNEQLEMLKTLCLLYAFYLSSKKKFNKVSDIVFYYSIVNYDLIKLIETSGDKNNISPNLYLRYQTKVNKILLKLSFLNYIEIKGDLSYKTKDLGIRLTNQGVEFLMVKESKYFSKLIDEYISVLSKIGNTSENRSKLKGGV